MRTRNAIERLAAAGRPLFADADALVSDVERDQILDRILASDESAVRRRRPIVIALVTAAVIGGAIAAVVTHGNAAPPTRAGGGHDEIRLTGAMIQAAGYHFRTPAGFAASGACDSATATPPGSPETPDHAMRAAASADGGCVEALYLIAGSPNAPTPNPPPGEAVGVGSYQGYYDVQGDADATLYVELPQGDAQPVFLVLFAQGLTEDQLIAVALSGLPSSP